MHAHTTQCAQASRCAAAWQALLHGHSDKRSLALSSHKGSGPHGRVLCAGKFACLDALLTCMVGQLQERVVVCAGSTQLLDEAASLCASHAWTTVRVDGSVTAHKRADIVHAFNTANIGQVLPGPGAGAVVSGGCVPASWLHASGVLEAGTLGPGLHAIIQDLRTSHLLTYPDSP